MGLPQALQGLSNCYCLGAVKIKKNVLVLWSSVELDLSRPTLHPPPQWTRKVIISWCLVWDLQAWCIRIGPQQQQRGLQTPRQKPQLQRSKMFFNRSSALMITKSYVLSLAELYKYGLQKGYHNKPLAFSLMILARWRINQSELWFNSLADSTIGSTCWKCQPFCYFSLIHPKIIDNSFEMISCIWTIF